MASSLIFANDPPLGFSNNQLEFLAEDEIITIVPNFEGDKLQLIMGDFGPFKPLKPVGVPLWLALSMKKKQMCSIQPPQWLHIDKLMNVLAAEKDDRETFQDLPFHYMELASLLLDRARDDIPSPHKVQSVLEDIWLAREEKRRRGLESLDYRNLLAINMNNLSAMEINHFRQTSVLALDQFHAILTTRDTAAPASSSSYSTSASQQSHSEGDLHHDRIGTVAADEGPSRKHRRPFEDD